MKLKNILMVGAISVGLWSCKNATLVSEESRTEVRKMVISPETTLLDVRVPEQFSQGTARDAINIPLAQIEKNIDFLRKQKQIVVFCNSGKQAAQAVEILKKNGLENVYDAKTLYNVKAIRKQSAGRVPQNDEKAF